MQLYGDSDKNDWMQKIVTIIFHFVPYKAFVGGGKAIQFSDNTEQDDWQLTEGMCALWLLESGRNIGLSARDVSPPPSLPIFFWVTSSVT